MGEISEKLLIALVIVAIGISIFGTVSTVSKLSGLGSITGQPFTSAPTGTANVTVPERTYITLTMSSIDFGDLDPTANNDTTDDSPAPFALRNDGTVNVNVTIKATDLFSDAANPSSAYQFKSRVDESGSVINSTSDLVTSLTNMPNSTSAVSVVKRFKFASVFDQVFIDIGVTVPADETAGVKSSTVTLTAIKA